MSGLGLILILSFLGFGLLFVVYVIAADKMRFLTRFDLDQWRDGYYLRSLPNFLQALHDNHFKTAWPSRCNAVSAAFFRFRTRAFLKRKPGKLRSAFLQQHIILFALRESLAPYIRDFLLYEQQKLIGNLIVEMEDTLDRERLVAYLDSLKAHRQYFQETLTSHDRRILVEMVESQFVPTLRRAHAIFQEHGYSLIPQFTQLRRWQELSGPELVQELPPLPLPKRPRLKVHN